MTAIEGVIYLGTEQMDFGRRQMVSEATEMNNFPITVSELVKGSSDSHYHVCSGNVIDWYTALHIIHEDTTKWSQTKRSTRTHTRGHSQKVLCFLREHKPQPSSKPRVTRNKSRQITTCSAPLKCKREFKRFSKCIAPRKDSLHKLLLQHFLWN
jgi:hypothetical protein